MQTRLRDLSVREPSPKVSLYNMMTEDAISVAISWMKSSPCVLDPVPDKLFGVGASSPTKKHVTTLFCSPDIRLIFRPSHCNSIYNPALHIWFSQVMPAGSSRLAPVSRSLQIFGRFRALLLLNTAFSATPILIKPRWSKIISLLTGQHKQMGDATEATHWVTK